MKKTRSGKSREKMDLTAEDAGYAERKNAGIFSILCVLCAIRG
jgi:hypothetical protein